MLSYMLPAVEEKPLDEESGGEFERALINEGCDNNRKGDASTGNNNNINSIGKDNSCNSFQSTVTSHSSMTNTSDVSRGKQKIFNGSTGKTQQLKRVSFGSSHGSMVETLIYENPVQEESVSKPSDCIITTNNVGAVPFQDDLEQTETEREKVRVKFFQQSKRLEVDLPTNEQTDFPVEEIPTMATAATVAINNSNNYHNIQRMESTDSGWENPFRPGGDLSREADEIVELIKGGKPITPTSSSGGQHILSNSFPTSSPEQQLDQLDKSANGNVVKKEVFSSKNESSSPGSVDVKRETVKPDGDGTQIEHVTIKKKPKCKCCVIQ